MIRILLLALFACCNTASAATLDSRDDLAALFGEAGVQGTFAFYDIAGDRITVVDRDRAGRRFLPASTFKIANSLIALETGALRDENEIVPYGGKPQPVKAWERDMSIADAIRISNVPVYQEIARRIGPERMQAGLDRLGYGNRTIGTVIDRFWLDGPLEISALEQVAFLAALAQQRLPVSPRTQEIVQRILKLEENGPAVLYGKTGWATATKPAIGWLVGWVARDGKVFPFALNIDMPNESDAPKRLVVVKALLGKLGAY